MVIKTGLISNIAFELFGIPIYWYAILIVSSMLIAILWCKLHDGRYNIKFDALMDLAIIMLPVAIICARIYYVMFSFDYLANNPSEIIKIKNGGLAIYGGIIGGLIVIAIYGKIKKIRILDITDYIVPIVAFCQSVGRWGNYINIEAYGTETTNILRMGIIENGKYIQVHPTFLYESVCTFIIFIVLYKAKNKREYSGQVTLAYFFMYGIIRSIVEGLRTDSLMLGSFRVSQVLSIILSIACGSILFYKRLKK